MQSLLKKKQTGESIESEIVPKKENEKKNLVTKTPSQVKDAVSEMVRYSWRPMLQVLSLLLEFCSNENIVQFVLKAYMSMTITCGVLELDDARNAFILSLCRFSIPDWHSSSALYPTFSRLPSSHGNTELQPKHLQGLKAVFNIAHGLGSILGKTLRRC